MNLWLLVFFAFLVQEPVSSDILLLEAYQYHYSIWIIHALFVIATLVDVAVGYLLGVWMQRRLAGSNARIVRYSLRTAEAFSEFAGTPSSGTAANGSSCWA